MLDVPTDFRNFSTPPMGSFRLEYRSLFNKRRPRFLFRTCHSAGSRPLLTSPGSGSRKIETFFFLPRMFGKKKKGRSRGSHLLFIYSIARELTFFIPLNACSERDMFGTEKIDASGISFEYIM